MTEEVFMDYPQVQKMSDSLGTFGEVLQNVSKILEATITVLRVTAFVGLVGGAALQRYLEIIKPIIDRKALKMLEMQRDVADAIKYLRDGDESGSSHFR